MDEPSLSVCGCPNPLEHLANAKHGRYVLSGKAMFCYRDEQWRARITGGKSVSYTITRTPDRGGRYLTASWATPHAGPTTLRAAAARAVGNPLIPTLLVKCQIFF